MPSSVVRYFLWVPGIVFLVGFFSACSTATKQPSLYDTQPDLLNKQYTVDEITAIEQSFETNPLQYSQELGNLLLWKMHQKSPEFALEFAQTPELNDGIDEKEGRAMVSIYNLIKGLDIPVGLFEEKEIDKGIHKIVMEWQGDAKANTDWSGYFYYNHLGEVLEAKPIGFEPGEDEFDHKYWSKNRRPKWKSIVTAGDTDGIAVTFRYPYNNRLIFEINDQMLVFKKEELPLQSQMSFVGTKGIQGTLTIKNVTEINLSSELYALRDIVLAGENDYRYSALMQALLWGYMDGRFKDGDNPFENYVDIVGFVKPIWGDMERARWRDFDTVVERLNVPELCAYYVSNNFAFQWDSIRQAQRPKKTFKKKGGVCRHYATFVTHCLSKAGYHVRNLTYRWGNGWEDGHTVSVLKDKEGNLFVVMDSKHPNSITGPYKSYSEIAPGIADMDIETNAELVSRIISAH